MSFAPKTPKLFLFWMGQIEVTNTVERIGWAKVPIQRFCSYYVLQFNYCFMKTSSCLTYYTSLKEVFVVFLALQFPSQKMLIHLPEEPLRFWINARKEQRILHALHLEWLFIPQQKQTKSKWYFWILYIMQIVPQGVIPEQNEVQRPTGRDLHSN